MKKILFVHQASAIGGGSFCMLNVIKELDRNLFDIEVMLPSEGSLCAELQKYGIKVHVVMGLRGIPYNRDLWNPRFFISYVHTFRFCRIFRSFLLEHKYDVVYLNSMVLYPFLKVAKTANVKTIIHIREHWPLKEHVFQLRYAQKQVEKYADKILAINRFSASMFAKSADKCSIVYDWVDMTGRYEHRPYSEIFGVDADKLKVYLYTGGFDRFKGPREVLLAFCRIKDPNARLLVLGNNPNTSKNKYIQECCNIIKNDERIVCIPRTYKLQHIVEQAYCVLSAFTVPHANLGLAESIILNKIVIAADNEEAREYSGEGKLALLFKPDSIDDFFKKITWLDENYSEFMRVVRENSEVIKCLFDKERNIAIVSDVLIKI